MSMQAEPGGAVATPNATNGAPQQTQGAPAAAPVASPPVQPEQAAPQIAPVSPQPAGRTPTRKLIGDADEIPGDTDLIELPPSALKNRLERFTKKQLRDSFGTDNVEHIRTKLQEHQQWATEREEKRMAELTESQRLQERLETAERERDEARYEAETVKTERVVGEQDVHVTSIMNKFINPRYTRHEAKNLAEYISGLSDAELADPDAVVEAWCRKTIEDAPELAVPQTAPNGAIQPATAPQAAPPVQPPGRPLTNGPDVQRPQNVNPGGIVAPKTFAPGQAGSANDKEWREYKRSNGWNF